MSWEKSLGSCIVKKQISFCLTQLVTESNWLCIFLSFFVFLAEDFDIMELEFHGTSFWEKLIESLKRKALKNIGPKFGFCPTQLHPGCIGELGSDPFYIAIWPPGSYRDWLRSLGLFKNLWHSVVFLFWCRSHLSISWPCSILLARANSSQAEW